MEVACSYVAHKDPSPVCVAVPCLRYKQVRDRSCSLLLAVAGRGRRLTRRLLWWWIRSRKCQLKRRGNGRSRRGSHGQDGLVPCLKMKRNYRKGTSFLVTVKSGWTHKSGNVWMSWIDGWCHKWHIFTRVLYENCCIYNLCICGESSGKPDTYAQPQAVSCIVNAVVALS